MKKLNFFGAVVLGLVIGGLVTFGAIKVLKAPTVNDNANNTNATGTTQAKGVAQFASADDFATYLESGQTLTANYATGFNVASVTGELGLGTLERQAAPTATDETGAGADRVSETNVQVKGIDEPDIVKVDSQNIYFSRSEPDVFALGREKVMTEDLSIGPPNSSVSKTDIIKAFPPKDLAKTGSIDLTGDLLLSGQNLVVFNYSKITSYDVTDPAAPKEKWSLALESDSSLVSSRLFNGKIYAITRTNINYDLPCPVVPLKSGGRELSIGCAEIYHPRRIVPVDSTYAALVINPSTGQVDDQVSFTGSASGNTVVYMSPTSLYVTYQIVIDPTELMSDLLKTQAQDLMPASVQSKIANLAGYDISSQAKFMEMGIIIENYLATLTDDEQLRIQTELGNRSEAYVKAKRRELEKTGLVRISLSDLTVVATGEFPGSPLNQFSLDEFENNLRVATTVSGGTGLGFAGTGESTNDVYILNQQLETVGSVLGLGDTERIYSARFIGDTGYLVTYRQVDPFYVLDLSNPQKPAKVGELKIPGFSSYLHPISASRILGVGEENSKVKLSLFDVSDAANPRELSKYSLDEYWTDVSSTHHAFLQDAKHSVVFIPGGEGGYVISYANDQLSLTKAVAGYQVKRAVYLSDVLYILGESKITALDEANWQTVKELAL